MTNYDFLNNVDTTGLDDLIDNSQSFETIGYSMRDGVFYVSADAIDNAPKSWKLNEEGTSYVTDTIKIAAIATRRRVSSETPDGSRHYYPQFTKKADVADASTYRQHMQLMCFVDGGALPVVFGINALSAMKCLDQKGNGKYDVPKIGEGALTILVHELRDAQKQTGKSYPFFTFWMTLKAAPKMKTEMGSGRNTSTVIPFVLDGELEFVGDNYDSFKSTLDAYDVQAWRDEWGKREVVAPEIDEVEEANIDDLPGFDL